MLYDMEVARQRGAYARSPFFEEDLGARVDRLRQGAGPARVLDFEAVANPPPVPSRQSADYVNAQLAYDMAYGSPRVPPRTREAGYYMNPPPPVPPRTREAGYANRHPLAARIKYKLLRKGAALNRRLERLEAQRGSGKYRNSDGSVRRQAIRLPGGGSYTIPLWEAQVKSVKNQMEAMQEDVTAFGLAKYLLNKVPAPPNSYSGRIESLKMQNAGTAVLQGDL